MPAKRLDTFLQGLPGALARETRKIAVLQKVYEAVAPGDLVQISRVAAFHAGRVTLLTDSGVFASKIKQLLPLFLIEFRQRGFDINAIEVRVQVRRSRRKDAIPEKITKQISTKGLMSFLTLETKLEDSPLRAAVSHLLASQRKRTSGRRP